jgi:prevent-host-death family protein
MSDSVKGCSAARPAWAIDVDTCVEYRDHMIEVGIRELKAHLSDYLDRAARGEVVRVTDRGRPKAVLGPVLGPSRIEEGIRAGWITPARATALGPVTRVAARRRVLDAIAEDRGE